jgi:hypothetical protein
MLDSPEVKNRIVQFSEKISRFSRERQKVTMFHDIKRFFDGLRKEGVSAEDFVAIKNHKFSLDYKGYDCEGINLFHLVAIWDELSVELLSIPSTRLSSEQVLSILQEPNANGVVLPYQIPTQSFFKLESLIEEFQVPVKEVGKLLSKIYCHQLGDPSIATFLYKADRTFNQMMHIFNEYQVSASSFLDMLFYEEKIINTQESAKPLIAAVSNREAIFYVASGFMKMKPSPTDCIRLLSEIEMKETTDASLVSCIRVLKDYSTAVKNSFNQRIPKEKDEIAVLDDMFASTSLNSIVVEPLFRIYDFIKQSRANRFGDEGKRSYLRSPESSSLNNNRRLSLSSRLQKTEVN